MDLDYPDDSIKYFEESWRLKETCCHLDSYEKLLVKTGIGKLADCKIIILTKIVRFTVRTKSARFSVIFASVKE